MQQIIGKRYILGEKLGEGGMGVVYRATDRLATRPEEQNVALKRVTTTAEHLDFTSKADSVDFRLALAQEFKTLSSLRHPNIISVLDYGFDSENTPYYTMDYVANPRTILEASRGKPQPAQAFMLVQVLQALEYLHRRGIIHRDLKPANVLVKHLPDGQELVKVVDFGLAVANGQAEEDQTVGTLAYMAPELLMGFPASIASDLYAFGILACEVLGGRHPYNTADPALLVSSILNQTPDIDAYDLSERLSIILKRLVARDPADRYPSALLILQAYNESLGQQVAYETRATRESFLQAAEFVGRERELSQLTDHLSAMLEGKGGAAWLIGGESGVGKSRLLEEIRAQAQVRGVRVLRGQAISERAGAFYMWREIFRWLALAGDPTDFEASVLKPFVPDIATLLQRTVDDAPEIAPQAAQDRIMMVVESLFRRQHDPHLIIMEDLHWAQESADLTQRLSAIASQYPLMIVGSYRNDEKPDLPDRLPAMQIMKINRLSKEEIARLSESMLGQSGARPHVVDLLQRETEGNVFFIVEVVRTLAEDAGRLDLIGQLTLPERVFAGGVQRVIERRMSQIPPDASELLSLAALIGRQLDLPTLQLLLPTTGTASVSSLEMWLTVCSDASIFVVADGKWQFGHDRLREGVRDKIPAEQLPALHLKIANALEQSHPDAFARLAYHYRAAGQTKKETYYAGLEGEQELHNGGYQAAIGFLERGLQDTMLTPERRAHLEQLLGDALYGIGKLNESQDHAQNALRLLGYPMPSTEGRRVVKLVRQVTRQLSHRLRPGYYIGKQQPRRDILLEASRAYERLAVLNYMFNNTVSTVLSTLYALNLAEEAGPSPEMARNTVNVGVAIGLVPLHGVTMTYMDRGLTIDDSPQAQRWVRALRGVYLLGAGNLDAALEETLLAGQLARQIGDERGYEESQVVSGVLYHHQGDFARNIDIGRTLAAGAFRRGDLQNYDSGTVIALIGLLRLGQHSGDLSEALKLCESLETRLSHSLDGGHIISGYGTMALIYFQIGQIDAALKAAERVTAIVFKTPPTSYYSHPGYVYVTELYLALWEQNPGSREYAALANKMIKQLNRLMRPFPVATAAALRCAGQSQYLSGKTDIAKTTWRKALEVARTGGLLYEQALAHEHLGRSGSATHNAQAAMLFEKLGVKKRD